MFEAVCADESGELSLVVGAVELAQIIYLLFIKNDLNQCSFTRLKCVVEMITEGDRGKNGDTCRYQRFGSERQGDQQPDQVLCNVNGQVNVVTV